MDGETAVTTVAADSAVDRGVLIFNSAGNEYNNAWHYIIAPADGDNVLAIAAVTSSGIKSSFSSVGPSADGRIKPDLAAMGSSVYLASSTNSEGFTYSNGTSFSCPLAAGAAAQLLSAFPDLTPYQVHEVQRSTASQAANPDTALGWGIIDIEAAYYKIDTSGLFPFEDVVIDGLELTHNYPNPFNPSTKLQFRLKYPSLVSVKIFNTLGEKIFELAPRQYNSSTIQTLEINMPANCASGIYFYKIIAQNTRFNRYYEKNGKMIFTK